VQDNYDKAKEAYVCWVQCGKPRCGLEYDAMYKTRAAFKLALRYCQRHDAQLRLDAHAKNLLSRCDYQTFWQGIKKDGCCKSQKYANRVDNAVGDTDICAMWKEPFKSLYNSVPDNGVKETVLGMI